MKFFPRKFTVLLFEIANNCQQSKCLHRGDLLNADNSEGRIYKPLTNWKRKGLIFFFFGCRILFIHQTNSSYNPNLKRNNSNSNNQRLFLKQE